MLQRRPRHHGSAGGSARRSSCCCGWGSKVGGAEVRLGHGLMAVHDGGGPHLLGSGPVIPAGNDTDPPRSTDPA